MNKRTTFDWQQECNYCTTVADKRGNVKEMNYSAATFLSYVRMQAETAAREGFDDAAEYLALIADDMVTLC